MKSLAISLALGLAAGAATLAVAQDRGGMAPDRPFGDRDGRGRFTQEDRAAFTDARLAALRASLRLTPEQDKLWPAVDKSLREFVQQKQEARATRRERWASFRDDREAGRPAAPRDIPAELHARSENLARAALAARNLSEATAPLYATLDESQKRRMSAMLHVMGRGGMQRERGGWGRDMREDRGEDRGRSGWRERRGGLDDGDRDGPRRYGRDDGDHRGRDFAERDGDHDDEPLEGGRYQ